MDALSLLIIIGPALLVIAMPYFLVYSFFRLGLKSDKPGIKRWTGSAIFVVVVGLIFYGDILFSSVQLARLCHTKAGIYVYKRVMVPDEMWDFENHMIKDNYRGSEISDSNLDAKFIVGGDDTFEHWGVKTDRFYIYHNENDKKKLVEQLDYIGNSGWFAKSIPFSSSPNLKCTTDQATRRRFELNDINSAEFFLFNPSSVTTAMRYSIHPSSYSQ